MRKKSRLELLLWHLTPNRELRYSDADREKLKKKRALESLRVGRFVTKDRASDLQAETAAITARTRTEGNCIALPYSCLF